MRTAIERGFRVTMGEESDDIVRRGTIVLAIFGFLAHLSLWALHSSGRIEILGDSAELVQSPLSATIHSILNSAGLRGVPTNSNYSRFVFIFCRKAI